MGITASADLAFGVHCGESGPLFRDVDEYGYAEEREEEDEDFDPGDLEAYLVKRAGIPDPWDKVPPEIFKGGNAAYKAWKQENPWFERELEGYRYAKEKVMEGCPVAIESAGAAAYDYSEYILVLSSPRFKRHCYGPFEALDSLPETPTEEEIQAAKDFCDQHDLRAFESPTWVLFSDMG